MLTAPLQFIAENAWTVCVIAIFFGGSIFVHELGHFLAARRKGLHVERFSIGFGPAIWSHRGKDGVEYRLSWFPLGGYVLLPQLADLGMVEGKSETDVSKLPPVSYGAKMLVFVAGAAFNILFAFALACVITVIGESEPSDYQTTTIGYVTPTIDLPNGQKAPSPAVEAGLRAGDIIRAIDGQKVHDFMDVRSLIELGGGRTRTGQPEVHFLVERNGRLLNMAIHEQLTGEEHSRLVGITGAFQPVVYQLRPDSSAEKAGFRKDDQVELLDGVPVTSSFSFLDDLHAKAGKPVTVQVLRDGAQATVKYVPQPGANGTFGFMTLAPGFSLGHPSPFAQVWSPVVLTVRTLGSLLNPHSDIGLSKMSGVIGIVHVYHEEAQAGMRAIIILTILINVNLAIINLLPIPVLDGGQMAFATIAWLRGRSLPMNFIMTTQSIFMMLILAVMVYIGWFDILRWRHG